MNSSYPSAYWLNGSTPPIFATLQVGQEHAVAKPFVADLEHRQPVPVEEEEERLHPCPHGLDPVRRQPHLPGHLGGPAGVQAAFAREKIGSGQDRRRVATAEHDWGG